MPMVNSCFVEGYCVRDVELRYVGSGVALAQFAIGHTRNFQKDGKWEKETSYIDVKAWGTTAERAAELSKGSHVVASGRLTQERWQAADGAARSKLVIVCDKLDVVSPSPAKAAPAKAAPNDDELPF